MVMGSAPDKESFMILLGAVYGSDQANFELLEGGGIMNLKLGMNLVFTWDIKKTRYRLIG